MLKVVKDGQVYAPWYMGKKDLLIIEDKIGALVDNINLSSLTNNEVFEVEIIEARNKLVVPGFIDGHVHIAGGGGEGGFKTRTPEIQFFEIVGGGITTVVGCLGTDGITREVKGLYAKAKSLEAEGLSTYIYTGSYHVPPSTITGKIQDDLVFVDNVIGVGEIAISDHRSSHPTVKELIKIASAARLGGILSGKKAVIHFHLGTGKENLLYIENIIEKSELPLEQFYPTHLNRSSELFENAIRYAKRGGYIDLTTTTAKAFLKQGEIKASKGLKELIKAGVSKENITFSSDGQGSLPEYDKNGTLTGLSIGKVKSLHREVRDAVLEEGLLLCHVLPVVTQNPAKILGLSNKGCLSRDMDGDVLVLDRKDLSIETVIAKGVIMYHEGKHLIAPTFGG